MSLALQEFIYSYPTDLKKISYQLHIECLIMSFNILVTSEKW